MSALAVLSHGLFAAADYPAAADVRAGIGYAYGARVGALALPAPGDVRAGVGYGGPGPEFTGALLPPPPAAAGIAPSETAEKVREAVRAKLAAALPDAWHAYARRDFGPSPGDEWPRCTVVLLPERIVEAETENTLLVAYPCAVALEVREAAVRRTDPPLSALRRAAQRAVHTTAYPGLPAVEFVDVEESAGVPLPDVEDGVTATAFAVVLGVIEDRSPAG